MYIGCIEVKITAPTELKAEISRTTNIAHTLFMDVVRLKGKL